MAQGVKTINRRKFFEAFDAFCSGRMTLSKAAKYIGISNPTASKYFNMYILGEPFPDTLFGDDERQKRIERLQQLQESADNSRRQHNSKLFKTR